MIEVLVVVLFASILIIGYYRCGIYLCGYYSLSSSCGHTVIVSLCLHLLTSCLHICISSCRHRCRHNMQPFFVNTLLLLFSFSRSIMLAFLVSILRMADSWRFDNFGGLWGTCLTLEYCGRCEARSTSFASAAQPLRPVCRLWVLVVALASPQCSKGRFKDLQDSFPHLI